MRDKKAISDVVATLLIILLTVIAITIVWGVLRGTITSTSQKIQMNCPDVNLVLTKAVCNTTDRYALLTLNSGKISKLTFGFYDANGNTVPNGTKDITIVPGVLESKRYDNNTLYGTVSLADVAWGSVVKMNVAYYVSSGTQDTLCGKVETDNKAC